MDSSFQPGNKTCCFDDRAAHVAGNPRDLMINPIFFGWLYLDISCLRRGGGEGPDMSTCTHLHRLFSRESNGKMTPRAVLAGLPRGRSLGYWSVQGASKRITRGTEPVVKENSMIAGTVIFDGISRTALWCDGVAQRTYKAFMTKVGPLRATLSSHQRTPSLSRRRTMSRYQLRLALLSKRLPSPIEGRARDSPAYLYLCS